MLSLSRWEVTDVAYATVIAIALIGLGIIVPFAPAHQHGGIIGLGSR